MEKPTEELVFDRTQQDVDRMVEMLKLTYEKLSEEQKAEWDSHRSKGSWNYTDANRVSVYINYLIEWLNSVGYYITDGTLVYDSWKSSDNFYTDSLQRIIDALNKLIGYIDSSISKFGYVTSFNYTYANELERVLAQLYEFSLNHERSLFYCGEVYCGEV